MLREIYNFSLHLSPTKQHFDSMKNIDMVSTNVTWSLNFYGPPPLQNNNTLIVLWTFTWYVKLQ